MAPLRLTPTESKRTGTLLSSTILLIATGIFLTSCTHPTPEPVQIPSELEQSRFSERGSIPQADRWWEAFDDADLNEFIEQAFSENLTLAQAWSRLAQAEASLKATGASRYPSLNFSANARRQWQNTPESARATDTTSGATAFNTSYELDLWGKIRNQYAGAVFDYQATEQELYAAAISLSAQISNTWYSLVEKRAQQQLLQAQYETAEQTLESIRIRFNNGNRNGTDLLQQEQVLESRKASLILNQAEIEVLEHSLAILSGKDPASASYPMVRNFPVLPAFPALGIPAETLAKRPDIQSSWLAIQSADADVAAAIANRFPSITLGGTISAAFGSPINLFENWVKSLSASLALPLFDGGARVADVERRQALLGTTFLQYQSAYIGAIKEVEDAIIREKQQLKYLESLDKQIKLAENVFDQTLNRYKNGNQTYLQVLTAQDSLHNLRRTKLTAVRNLLNYRTSLYQAIGGSFDLTPSEAWQNAAVAAAE